jgi:hypothetical protein
MIPVTIKFFMVSIPLVFLIAETGKIFRNCIPKNAKGDRYVIILYQL